ncbi:MAG: radical SAM family heme chaperone HemW [Treponema sp.]|nr:radical SAM family heme chaperone HemW [Treponema sp.]
MSFLPESLYIHIPFCLSKCSYCDFFSRPFKSVPDDYVSALCKELNFRLKNISQIKTVYIGGGTPSLLTESHFLKIISNIPLSNIKEFTVEVNPDDVTPELLKFFEKNGVTRISCGIQSFNDEALKFCNRRAKREQVLLALKYFTEFWKKDLSLDLISGLPFETEESFFQGLEIAVNSKADHISLYSLTIEEETSLGKLIDSGKLEYNFDKADSLWIKGKEFLELNGFLQYEVSNFCRNGKESLHNMSYWNHESYIGCGSGGTGTIYNKDGTAKRWTNVSNIKEYISFWNSQDVKNKPPVEEENLSKETEVFEFFMMGLRKIEGISDRKFEYLFGTPIPENIKRLFEKWEKRGVSYILKSETETKYTLGKSGIIYLNKFLQELLEHL